MLLDKELLINEKDFFDFQVTSSIEKKVLCLKLEEGVA